MTQPIICKSIFPAPARSDIQWVSAVDELTTLKTPGVTRDRHILHYSTVAALGKKGQVVEFIFCRAY